MDAVVVKHTAEHELTLEWASSATNDMVADAALALINGIDKSPASVKCAFSDATCRVNFQNSFLCHTAVTTQQCSHAHSHADAGEREPYRQAERIAWFLEAHFGDIQLLYPPESGRDEQGSDAEAIVRVDNVDAHVDLITMVQS